MYFCWYLWWGQQYWPNDNYEKVPGAKRPHTPSAALREFLVCKCPHTAGLTHCNLVCTLLTRTRWWILRTNWIQINAKHFIYIYVLSFAARQGVNLFNLLVHWADSRLDPSEGEGGRLAVLVHPLVELVLHRALELRGLGHVSSDLKQFRYSLQEDNLWVVLELSTGNFAVFCYKDLC